MLLNLRFLFLACFLLSCLGGCSSSSSTFPCLCDIPPLPDIPSNETLRQDLQQETRLP